jgi:uncharacterized membrane protein YphA (DoxX/SURF4 family)
MAVSPTSPPPPPLDKSVCCPALNLTLAFLLLRLFMGMRLVLSGFEKMGYFVAKGTATFKEALTLKEWLGDPAKGQGLGSMVEEGGASVLLNQGFGGGKMWPIAKAMLENTLLPAWMIKPFLICLPYAMVVSGLLILLGLFNRAAWWVAGLIWFSLAFGQMLLPDEQTIQWLGLYVFVCALALAIVEHNRVRLTKW